MTGEEALNAGMVPVPPEDLERVALMTDEERLEYARGLMVRTKLESGAERVRPVGGLMDRGLKRRADRNRKKRARRARR
jgi:hypothetical protein